MRFLVAFDKFKDALSAPEACQVASEVLLATDPHAEVTQAPLTDGGEGFARILTDAVDGEVEILTVLDPLFAPMEAVLGWVELARLPAAARQLLDLPAEGRLAVVEMAQASGLELLPPGQRNPLHTSTFGTGQMIAHAAAEGADAILVGIGGSATNDLGLGALEALGLTAYDQDMQPVRHISPAKWDRISSLGGLVNSRQKFPPLRIASDVDNPLLGERGATAAFGAQKGLREEDRERLERGLRKQALRLLGLFGQDPVRFSERLEEPGSGAAGGIGFGLRQALPDARFVPGFPLVEAWLGLPDKIAEADCVITGEGGFDLGSLEGKGPGRLLRRAVEARRPVHAFVGALDPEAAPQVPEGAQVHVISPPDVPLAKALAETPLHLASTLHGIFAK